MSIKQLALAAAIAFSTTACNRSVVVASRNNVVDDAKFKELVAEHKSDASAFREKYRGAEWELKVTATKIADATSVCTSVYGLNECLMSTRSKEETAKVEVGKMYMVMAKITGFDNGEVDTGEIKRVTLRDAVVIGEVK